MRTFLFLISFVALTFIASAQKQTSDTWLKTITANTINKPGLPNKFMAAKSGFALYFSESGKEKVPYLVYVPKGYDPANPTPVVVFLHGAIHARDDFYHHNDPAIADEPIFSAGEALNTIVVFPFGKLGFAWPAQQAANENIINMVNQVKERYNVNNKKVILGGISMGGAGTYWFINNRAVYFSGFFAFSAIPHELDLTKISEGRPLYSMFAKDDPGCPYNEVAGYYEQHKKNGWYMNAVEKGGHRFIYNDGGKQFVRSIVSLLLN